MDEIDALKKELVVEKQVEEDMKHKVEKLRTEKC